MSTKFPVKALSELQTPFYYYDTKVLRETIDTINYETKKYKNYHVHYSSTVALCVWTDFVSLCGITFAGGFFIM